MAVARRSWKDELRADFRRPRSRRSWLRLGAWALIGFGLITPPIRAAVGYPDAAFPFTLLAASLAIVWVAPRDKEIRTWLFYAVSLYFFTQLRGAADDTAIAASTGYVLDWEAWLFGGGTPSAWLQERLGGADGSPGGVAYLSTLLHWSWFVLPHAIVIATYFLARPLFFRVAAIMIGTFFFAVLLYYLVPTVPPWLAVEEGATTGIRRVMLDTGPTFFGRDLFNTLFDTFAEPNPRAAMPSLHFAAAVMIMIISGLLRMPRLFASATLYSLALGFALVYLGEHYFVDILVGGLAALAAWFIVETALGNGPGLRLSWAVVGRVRWPHLRGRAPSGLSRPAPRADAHEWQ